MEALQTKYNVCIFRMKILKSSPGLGLSYDVRLQITTVTSHESATGTEKEPYQRGAAIRIEDHMVTPIGYGEIRGEPVDHIKHRGDQEPSRSVIHDMAPPFRSTHYKSMHYQIERLSSMPNPSPFHHIQCPFHRNAAPIV